MKEIRKLFQAQSKEFLAQHIMPPAYIGKYEMAWTKKHPAKGHYNPELAQHLEDMLRLKLLYNKGYLSQERIDYWRKQSPKFAAAYKRMLRDGYPDDEYVQFLVDWSGSYPKVK
jgi:hypothetical protein